MFYLRSLVVLAIVATALFVFDTAVVSRHANAETVTTLITISICGDAIVNAGEVCDLGVASNTGAYGSSTAGAFCNSDCSAWGPFCGDVILQPYYGEECDDGNNTSGDFCSATCIEEPAQGTGTPQEEEGGPNPPPPPGAGSSGSGFGDPVTQPTKVIIKGKAYPDASINILKDGEIESIVKADAAADFFYQSTLVTPGTATFGFWADDGFGRRSLTFTSTFEVVESAVTTVSGVFLPPTLELSDTSVKPGELLNIEGRTVPNATVFTHVDDGLQFLMEATSTQSGEWAIQFDTTPLSPEEFHTAKSQFEMDFGAGTPIRSGFGRVTSFFVGDSELSDVISADLNRDGFVNLIDFSILLFHWGTSEVTADLNVDGSIDLTDFSIMLFNWTG